MNDDPTEKKIAVYIFSSVISACLSNCVRSEKRLSILPASGSLAFFYFVSSYLFFWLRYDTCRQSIKSLLHKSKTHKKATPFRSLCVPLMGPGRYLRGSLSDICYFRNIHVIDVSDCIDIHFQSLARAHIHKHPLRVPAAATHSEKKNPFKIYAQFKNL